MLKLCSVHACTETECRQHAARQGHSHDRHAAVVVVEYPEVYRTTKDKGGSEINMVSHFAQDEVP